MAEKSLYEKELLAQVAAGDEKAFATLFHRHWDHIYTVALSITRSPTRSEDLVQEIFLKIWLSRDKLVAIENFENYLFIIARNAIYTSLRLNGVKTEPILDNQEKSATTPEDALVAKEYRQLLFKAVEQLSPQQREVYRLSREGGLKYEAIARQMGISKNTVRLHMIKALHHIRQYFKGH